MTPLASSSPHRDDPRTLVVVFLRGAADGLTLVALGGGVRGGRVLGGWPGLTPELLDGPGDLPVWNNYRNVLAPVLRRHGAEAASLAKIFPDFALSPLALY